jgi:hypothetical protein
MGFSFSAEKLNASQHRGYREEGEASPDAGLVAWIRVEE